MLSQYFNIIIYHGISAPGHGREVLDGLNAIHKSFIFHLMANVQLPGSEQFDTKMSVQTEIQNTDIILVQ